MSAPHPPRTLPFPAGFDPKTQAIIGTFVASMDDQSRRLNAVYDKMSIEQLEWQPSPGNNTIGMLLAHNAIVEAYWFHVSAQSITDEADAEAIVRRLTGIGPDDDGMPLARDGGHPESLRGKYAAEYLAMNDTARAATHELLKTWYDADLEQTFLRRERNISRGWTIYHVLEHYSGHYGQVLLLRHLMRDAGLFSGELD